MTRETTQANQSGTKKKSANIPVIKPEQSISQSGADISGKEASGSAKLSRRDRDGSSADYM